MKAIARFYLATAACLLVPALAFADTTTVAANADIYAAGSQSALASGDLSGQSGTVPGLITVTGGSYVTFGVTGTITLNGGGNYNDADGVGAGTADSYNTGYGSISGINAPGAGELVGVFIDGNTGGPNGSQPTTLDYTTTGNSSESDPSYSPVLDQTFFIGDGLTGDATGTTQEFYAPEGATELYLGISDAGGYNGAPGSYLDNSGDFDVTYDVVGAVAPPPPSVTPEPSSLALLGTGVLGAAATLRRRFVKR